MISLQKNERLTKEVQYGSWLTSSEVGKNEHVLFPQERLFLFPFPRASVVMTFLK
jgi:hypothetical protein